MSSKKLRRNYPVVSKKCGNKVRVEMNCWHKEPMVPAQYITHPVLSGLAKCTLSDSMVITYCKS